MSRRDRLRPARGRHPLRRARVRRRRARRRRDRVHDLDVGLPGGDDRPQLRRPADHVHLPADRQLRRLAPRRWSPTGSTPARRSCARRSTARTRRAPSAGWLSWLTDCGVPAITELDTRALVRHIRDAGRDARRRVPGARRRGARRGALIARRAGDERPRPGARGDARGATSCSKARRRAGGPRIAMIDTGVKLSIVRNLRERGATVELHPCTASAAASCSRNDPDAIFLANGPGDPAALDYIVDDRPRARRQAARVRHLPRPPAAVPRGRPRDLQAAVRPPRRQPSGQGPDDRPRSRSPARTTASRCSGPSGAKTIDGDEPVRWETDFGAAELTHINLYDRTVEGLALRDVPGATVQYHPEAGPGPHDALYLFDRFVDEIRADAAG